MRGCRHSRRRILRAVDQELAVEERFLLEEHLARCSACAGWHARTLALEEVLAASPEPPEDSLDVERAAASIRAALERGEPGARPVRRFTLPRVAAAALVLALGASVWAVLRPGGTDRAGGGPTRVTRVLVPAPAPEEPPVALDPVPLDREEVRRRVRTHLRTAFRERPPHESAGPAAERFDELAAELHRWPLVRVAEELLHEPDPEVAVAAARYLGARGDRISASKLSAALEEGTLGTPGLDALAELGEPGVPALAAALADPEHRAGALRGLVLIGGPAAARALGDAALERLRTSPRELGLHASYLEALAESGPAAVSVLLELAARDGVDAGEPLGWLDVVPGGARELVRLLEREGASSRTPLLLEAVAQLQPEAALPWLEERCMELRHREAALACLARWEGTAPVEVLLQLDLRGRLSDEEVLACFRVLADREGDRLAEQARELVTRADQAPAQRYLELLVASGHEAAAGALAVLALAGELPDGDRQWAALAVGELGRPEDALRLLRGLERMSARDRRLVAACLITIQRQLGDDGTSAVLDRLPERGSRRVRVALDEVAARDAGAVGLARVARALDGALPDPTPRLGDPAL